MMTFTTIASTGRRRNVSVSATPASSVLRSRLELGLGLDAVVDEDRRAIAQLEPTRGHDLLARVDALGDRDEVAALLADAHEHLLGDRDRLAVPRARHPRRARRLGLDEEHRVAVGR